MARSSLWNRRAITGFYVTKLLDILFIARSLEHGGAERQLAVLAVGLKKRGHKVAVALFYPGGPLTHLLRGSGVEVISLGKRGRWDIFSFLQRLSRLIQQRSPDIIHGYLAVPNLLCTLIKFRFPQIKVAWGVRASDMQTGNYDYLSRLSYTLERRLSQRADLIIVNSFAGLNHATKKGFPVGKLFVVQNGIDTQYFKPDNVKREEVRQALNITDGQQLIGLVGRLDPMKGYGTFLLAAAGLKDKLDHVRFVCVGDGPEEYRQLLASEAEKLGLAEHLIWLKGCSDMASIYNAMDLFTLSSHYGEGFPNVVAEAMACGIPAVVTDVGDAAEIVGKFGRVVPPANPDALMAAWHDMLINQPNDSDATATAMHGWISENYSQHALYINSEHLLLKLRS